MTTISGAFLGPARQVCVNKSVWPRVHFKSYLSICPIFKAIKEANTVLAIRRVHVLVRGIAM